MNNRVVCDICGREFGLNKSNLNTVQANLYLGNDTWSDPVEITFLTCPCCGKQYPVIVDDSETTALMEDYKELYKKRQKWLNMKKPVPQKLQAKYKALQKKISFNRMQIAEKYSNASYQLEDGTFIQLDYRYHER